MQITANLNLSSRKHSVLCFRHAVLEVIKDNSTKIITDIGDDGDELCSEPYCVLCDEEKWKVDEAKQEKSNANDTIQAD